MITVAHLPTPSQAAIAELNSLTSCIPDERERPYYLARMLYDELGLDWRNEDHKAHVDGIVLATCGESVKGKSWARVND